MEQEIIDFKKGIGKNVRSYRMKRGLTQGDLAKLTNCRQDVLSGIENGKRGIQIIRLYELARVLKVKPYQLLVIK